MPRDSQATKTRLLDEAERLFASRGIYAVTNREITEAAGQRNVSALNYHFGSRDQLLGAVLMRRGQVLDARRDELGADLDEHATTGQLVGVLVQVYADCLRTPWGPAYVRIVDQLRAGLGEWRSGAAKVDVHLQRILSILEDRPDDVPLEIRRHRLVAMMMLMTGLTAARAQRLADGTEPDLDHDAFLTSLTDMLVAVLSAPATLSV